MTYESNYLAHYGIPGQKWGVRRFQNEDGTLTEAGKDRYLKSMTDQEKSIYQKMTYSEQKYIKRKMDKGKTFKEALSAKRKADTVARILGLGLFVYNAHSLSKNPLVKAFFKSSFKNATAKVFSTKTALRGKNLLKHILQRANKNNVVLNKNSYKIFDPRIIANRG